MGASQKVPTNPLSFIQTCVEKEEIFWTYHVTMRLRERSINANQLVQAASTFEIIESYPDDKYLPSYLVFCKVNEQIFHILFATDVEEENVRVVTAYRPDASAWDETLKRRRQL